MSNFDDIFEGNAPRKGQTNQPFDKEAWAEKKQAERQAVYDLADTTAEAVSADGSKFQAYLDVQTRFSRYSTTNVLLILAQKPDATQLKDFDGWKDAGASIKRQQKGISILEPGEEYEREDGSIGTSYNVKRVFDISQTTARAKAQPSVSMDDRLLLKALISRPPVPIQKLIDLLIKNKAKNEGKALNTKDAQYKRVCKRLEEVNRLVDKLYEDNISGKINETNFVRLLSKYQQEQESILAEKGKLESETAAVREIRSDAEQFADLLERYGDITELTPEILNMLVDKIMVYEPRAVDGVMRQQIDVYYRYIGVVKLVDYGSTTYYKSGEVLTAAKKRENAKMEKRIAAVKEEMQSDEAVSA